MSCMNNCKYMFLIETEFFFFFNSREICWTPPTVSGIWRTTRITYAQKESMGWSSNDKHESKICRRFWPNSRFSQQMHIFIASRGAYRLKLCKPQHSADLWLWAELTRCSKQQRRWQRRILMTKSIPGLNKSHRMMLWGPPVLCENAYASLLRAFWEGLSNLDAMLTVVPLLRNIFLSCQCTDGCELCRKLCGSVSQSPSIDWNAFV